MFALAWIDIKEMSPLDNFLGESIIMILKVSSKNKGLSFLTGSSHFKKKILPKIYMESQVTLNSKNSFGKEEAGI